MYRDTAWAGMLFFLLSVFVTVPPLCLGQGAPEEAKAPASYTKLSPAEQRALRGVVLIAFAEERCQALVGSYVSLEKLVEGCRAASITVTIPESFDPRRDPDYDFRLSVRADSFELAATPKREGAAEFACDGKNVFIHAAGSTSGRDRLLGDRGATLREFAAILGVEAPPPRRRRVWTEENLGEVKGRVSVVGEGTTGEAPPSLPTAAEVSAGAGQEVQFSAPEACATVGINNIIGFESLFCQSREGRICSLEELEEKVAEENRSRGQAMSPGWSLRQDDNYRYELTVRGDRFDVAATPKRSGLGGFYCRNAGPGGYLRGEQCFYNRRGAASSGDTPVSESSMSGMGCLPSRSSR